MQGVSLRIVDFHERGIVFWFRCPGVLLHDNVVQYDRVGFVIATEPKAEVPSLSGRFGLLINRLVHNGVVIKKLADCKGANFFLVFLVAKRDVRGCVIGFALGTARFREFPKFVFSNASACQLVVIIRGLGSTFAIFAGGVGHPTINTNLEWDLFGRKEFFAGSGLLQHRVFECDHAVRLRIGLVDEHQLNGIEFIGNLCALALEDCHAFLVLSVTKNELA